MEHEDILPPFWQPPAAVALARQRRHRRQPLSPLLNSSLLIILLPSFTLLFTVFIFIPWISKHIAYYNKPPIPINTTPPIHKSISIRKSWDSLNVVLVIFAILCGIFAKRKDDVSSRVAQTDEVLNNTTSNNNNNNNNNVNNNTNYQIHHHQHSLRNELSDINTSIDDNPSVLLHRSKSSVPHWFEYTQSQGNFSPVNNSPSTVLTGMSRLRRTVSSDPYMRYQNTGTNPFRFFDDLDISKFYPKEDDEQQLEQPPQFADVAPVKEIPVDNFVLETQGELPSPTLSPPKTPQRDPPPPPQTPPPPPPPPPPAKQRRTFQTVPRREEAQSYPPPPAVEKKRSTRKRMKATKEIATAIVSLYSNRKRKRRAKSRRNCDDSSENQSQSIPPPSPPPPPPPPPPPAPPTVFHSWFKKSSKSKKIHSLSSIPKPPTGRPPLPRRRDVENGNGSESPMNVIPPPPPPPQFKVTGMTFPVVGGGYMRVEGGKSWRCEIEGEDDATSTTSNGREEGGVTCPSPDVNTKADTFIARQQDGWRLEKLNSWREKQKKKTGNGW